MSTSARASATRPLSQARLKLEPTIRWDLWLLGAVLALLFIGLVMMGSASIAIAEKQLNDSFYYIWRQSAFIFVALILSLGVIYTPIRVWSVLSPYLLALGIVLLFLVLIFGNQVNGSTRWFDLGLFNIQPSELVKLFVVLFMAGYLVRREEEVRTTVKGFLKPMLLLGFIGVLLLLEPDFGASVVIAFTAMGMMFLGGVRIWQFGVLVLLMSFSLAMLALSSPERMERITSFVNPWDDPFDSDFQLTQALIAFGRGEMSGVGLGASVQKLFYLPEAHTDFLFAVISEELGLMGGLLIIGLFTIVVVRALKIGHMALANGDKYAGYVAFGIGLLIGCQAYINIGVNMGVLPTKGLTLPLMSYGGSSIVATCLACALLFRISHEHSRENELSGNSTKRSSRKKGNG